MEMLMKSFQQFISESITINGDFNGTLNVGSSQPEPADDVGITIQGLSYRMKHWGPERGYQYV
jgi:hypothetical protein